MLLFILFINHLEHTLSICSSFCHNETLHFPFVDFFIISSGYSLTHSSSMSFSAPFSVCRLSSSPLLVSSSSSSSSSSYERLCPL